MSDRRAERWRCRFCGAERPPPTVDADPEDEFCSAGCRHLADALDDGERGGDDRRAGRDETRVSGAETDPQADGTDRTFFRVDGMHTPQCEAFLESVVEGRAGVAAVEASYVTEAVRVDHDPDRVTAAELRDALSTAGYTAYRREEADADDAAGRTRRAREMTGLRKRRTDDMLEIRYVAGVVFGSFLLVPYVAILYPVFLASVTDWGPLAHYEGAFTSLDVFLFPLFFVLTGLVLYLAGMPLLRGAYVGLKLRRPNAHLLATLTVASAYCYGSIAFLIGRNDVYFDLAIVVAAVTMGVTFYEAGVKREAVARLTDLTISQVEEARLVDGTTVPVGDVAPGDRILVRGGERIPVDGVLAEGACTVDEAVVTGESLPVRKEAGDAVVGGAVVTSDAAVVEVGAADDETAASAVEDLTRTVWSLQSADHGVQRRVDDLAATLLPIVLAVAVVVGVAAVALDASPTTVALAVLLSLLVTSPWALAFATPLSVGAAVSEALDRGIVVFDETVFERLRGIDVVVFDKTGTLTAGEMAVREVDAPEELLGAAAALERRASHPAATAIVDAFGDGAGVETNGEGGGGRHDEAHSEAHGEGDDGGHDETNADGRPVADGTGDGATRADGSAVDGGRTAGGEERSVEEFRTHPLGVSGVVDGASILVGHPDLFRERGWKLSDDLAARAEAARANGGLPVVLGRDGRAAGIVVLGDDPRGNWAETLARLGADREVVLLTGDDDEAAAAFREHPAVAAAFADVPPSGKTEAVRRLGADRRVAMVGDGTNDAPALAAADLGMALGGGTALAADAADLALLEDDLAAVEAAFALASAARRRRTRTLGLALSFNAIAIPAAVLGVLSPLVTAVALTVTCLLVAANCFRPLIGD